MDLLNFYSVSVKEFISVAHSLPSEVFSKAKHLHGATFAVIVSAYAAQLDENNLVIDMVKLKTILQDTLEILDYQNLDEIPHFAGKLTTTEFLAKYIFDSLRDKLNQLRSEGQINPSLKYLKIELKETDLLSASYFGKL